MCARFTQVDDQTGVGKPTEYDLVVGPVDVGLNNSYLFTNLNLEVRAPVHLQASCQPSTVADAKANGDPGVARFGSQPFQHLTHWMTLLGPCGLGH